MADYQLRVDGSQEPIEAPQTRNEQEGQCETLALFAFPETMRGQLDLGGPIRDLDVVPEGNNGDR